MYLAPFVFFVGFGEAVAIDSRVAVIEETIVAARRSITSASVVWHSVHTSPRFNGDRISRIYFDSRGWRRDFLIPYSDARGLGFAVGERRERGGRFRELTCRANDVIVLYNDVELENGGGLVMEMRDINYPDTVNDFRYAVPDFRMLGLVTMATTTFVHTGLDRIFARGDRVSASIEAEEFAGVACQRITEEFTNGSTRTLWVDPERQNVPLRVQFTDESGSESVESRYEFVAKPGIWFPRECTFENTFGTREVLTVTELTFNEPLSADVFELSGMGIKAGVPILRIPDDPRGPVYWNGTEIVPRDVEPLFNERPASVAADERKRLFLLANGVLFGGLALFLLMRAIRSRPTPR